MELWDIYDRDRRKTGRLHRRGEILQPGDYHLVVGIVVYNGSGQVLITKRDPKKSMDPGRWESTVGSVLAGEDSHSGARRELWEETGLDAAEGDLRLIYQTLGSGHSGGALIDIYIVKKDVPLEQIRLQPGETCDARWVDAAQWTQGVLNGKLLFLGRDKKEMIVRTVLDHMNKRKMSEGNI